MHKAELDRLLAETEHLMHPAADYRWNVRGVDAALVRRLRMHALEDDRPVGDLLNDALRGYLEARDRSCIVQPRKQAPRRRGDA